MKILQVAPYYSYYAGGQERYVRNLAKALTARGHSVKVFTSDFPGAKSCSDVDGVEVRRFDFLCRPLNNPISLKLFFNLVKNSGDFDIIHTHNEHSFASLCCTLTRFRSRIPLIVTCHGRLVFDQFAKDILERAYSRTLGSNILRKADRIISISDSDKNYLCGLGVPQERIDVIPNGVDLGENKYNNDDTTNEIAFEGRRVILFVGPLIRRKGPHILIRAIPTVVAEYPDAVFVFVGGGSFKEEAEKLSRELHVEDYTSFLGYVPEDKLNYLYRRSDIFVLPSFSEALSYSILDAFVFSKPVVSTLIPCIKDYLTQAAWLVPPADPQALADAVIGLLSDEKLALSLGANGRKLVETCFRWDLVVDRVLNTYHKALNS